MVQLNEVYPPGPARGHVPASSTARIKPYSLGRHWDQAIFRVQGIGGRSAAVIELRDTVFMATPPQNVWAWLADLPGHYREWHPGHVRCWYEHGNVLQAGTVLAVEEELHGRPHHLKLRATEVVPNRLLRYSSWGLHGAFLLEEVNGGTRFTATLRFGVAVPLIGPLVERILSRVFATRLAAVQEHMHEEGRNLKRLLERAVVVEPDEKRQLLEVVTAYPVDQAPS